jgi:hypothetical protein
VSSSHSEALAEESLSPNWLIFEILHFVQNDKHSISLITTKSPRRGKGEGVEEIIS